LPSSTDERGLREAFAAHDLQPENVYVARDRARNRSRGYAFVAMRLFDEAARAMGALNASYLGGRKLIVRAAPAAGRR